MLPIPKSKYMYGANFAFIKFGAWMYPVGVIRRQFPAGYAQSLHFHDFPQVWYCHAGSYIHQLDDREYACQTGSLIVVPAGVWHGFSVPEGQTADIFCIEVKYSLFKDTAPGQYPNAMTTLMLPCFSRELGWSFHEEYCLSPESQERAEEWLSDLAILDFKTSGTRLERICEKLELLFTLPELALPAAVLEKGLRVSEQKFRPLVQALCYLNENYAQKILAEDLLRVAALCHTNFCRYFRRFTALSYSEYLVQLRNARVALLLSNTTYSLAKIAELCGFSDTAHMFKCFNRQNGRLLKEIRGNARLRIEADKDTESKLREKLIE